MKRKYQYATSFTKKTVRIKLHERNSARNKFHDENWFRKEKKQGKSFHELNQIYEEKFQNILHVYWTKIMLQQVSRTKISSEQVPRTKISSIGTQMFQEKNQHATSSLRVNSVFTWRKINIQISQRDKSTCKNFHEQNQFHEEKNQRTSFTKRKINVQEFSQTKISTRQVPRTKISTQEVPCIKWVSRGEKSMHKFHEEKNQHAIGFTKKISVQ